MWVIQAEWKMKMDMSFLASSVISGEPCFLSPFECTVTQKKLNLEQTSCHGFLDSQMLIELTGDCGVESIQNTDAPSNWPWYYGVKGCILIWWLSSHPETYSKSNWIWKIEILWFLFFSVLACVQVLLKVSFKGCIHFCAFLCVKDMIFLPIVWVMLPKNSLRNHT